MLLSETSIASSSSKASPVRNCHAPSSASRAAISTGLPPSTMDRTVMHATLGGLSNGHSEFSKVIFGLWAERRVLAEGGRLCCEAMLSKS